MVSLDSFESLVEDLKNSNGFSRILVDLGTVLGIILIFVSFIKLSVGIYKNFRLYVWSQLFFGPDLCKRYGKWVVISGATDGIGQSMALEFTRRGFSIIILGRNKEKLANTKAKLEMEKDVGEVITIKIDLSDSSVENFEKIRGQIDPDNRDIGILVNNAGSMLPIYQRLHRMDMETLESMANVNMLATVYLTRMILPGMIARRKGLILNVSSVMSLLPHPFAAIYAPTKAFINLFTQNLQYEYDSYPIDIVLLSPGMVATKMIRNLIGKIDSNLFVPSSQEFAKSTVNALSARYKSLCGSFIHESSLFGFHIIKLFKLVPVYVYIAGKLFVHSDSITPKLKRKNCLEP